MKRRIALCWLALVAAVGFGGGAAHGENASAPPSEEAWYSLSPTCALPVGCTPLAPPSRYPAGTLHVGVTGGLEDARTYLKLDVSTVPSGATVSSATLTLPVAPAGDGTSGPETAQLVVCPATAPFTAGEGQTATPPAVECGTPVTAAYAAGTPATFTADITSLVNQWVSGSNNNGLAVMAAPGTAPGTSWHVAFSSAKRQGGSVPAISAAIAYDATAEETFDALPVQDLPVDFAPVPADSFTGSLTPFVTPPPASPAAAVVAQSQLPATVQPVTQVTGPGFAYPVVMVLPLLLLGLGGYLGWALTRPLQA